MSTLHRLSADLGCEEAAVKLVADALAILRTIDPSPSRSLGSGRNPPSGLFAKTMYYTKQVVGALLLYTPSTLEEPVDGKKSDMPGGALGKKLKAAVDSLETAARVGRNSDAIFLLAQMNFVCLPTSGVMAHRGSGVLICDSMAIGRIRGATPSHLRNTRNWPT